MEQQNEPSEPEHAVNISHSPMKHNKVPDLAAGAVLASSDEMPEGSEKVFSDQKKKKEKK